MAKSQKPKDPDAVNERYRITIPEADDVARRWAATQSNLSLSLRILIRKCVLDLGGYEDVAMRELNMPIKRGPGRPRKDAAKLLFGQAVPVPPRPPSLLSGPVVQPTQAPAPEPPRRRSHPRPRPRRGPSTTSCAREARMGTVDSSPRLRQGFWRWVPIIKKKQDRSAKIWQ